MGEAKRRKQAQQAGKPWPQRGAPVVAKPQSSQEFLDQLAPETRAEFFRLFESSRDATRGAIAAIRAGSAARRWQGLENLARSRHADLETAVDAAFDASDEGREVRRSVACRKGCYFCCHVNVSTTIPDAILVAYTILSRKPSHFAAAVKETAARIAGLDPVERYRQAIPCPMLEDGACGIHEARPTACRAYLATDARKCEASLVSARGTGAPTPVESLAYPQQLSAAISNGVLHGCADAGLQDCAVELSQATDLILRDPTVIDRWLNGESVFEPYRA